MYQQKKEVYKAPKKSEIHACQQGSQAIFTKVPVITFQLFNSNPTDHNLENQIAKQDIEAVVRYFLKQEH